MQEISLQLKQSFYAKESFVVYIAAAIQQPGLSWVFTNPWIASHFFFIRIGCDSPGAI